MTGVLDEVLVDAHFSSCHATPVRTEPQRALQAVRDLDLGRSRTVRALFALRGLPPSALRLDGFESIGFVLLDEAAHHIVLGLIAMPWRLDGGIRVVTAAEFAAFDEPGYAKVAWSFEASGSGESCLLRTETRIRCTDASSRRRFGLYWRLVGPFSGLVRRVMLDRVRRDCEAAAAGPAPPASFLRQG